MLSLASRKTLEAMPARPEHNVPTRICF
jgi:hypothetical protein